MLLNIIYVGLGGFIGASLRYLASGIIGRFTSQGAFPYGTFAVNMLGCFLIGFFAGVADSRDLFNPAGRAFLFTGVLGAFTTFSTFSFETMGLFQSGHTAPALANLALQILLGLVAVWIGLQLSHQF